MTPGTAILWTWALAALPLGCRLFVRLAWRLERAEGNPWRMGR